MPDMAIADTSTSQLLDKAYASSTSSSALPAGLSSAQSLGIESQDSSRELADVDTTRVDASAGNAADGTMEDATLAMAANGNENEDEEEEDDEDVDDTGMISEISDQDAEEDEDDDDEQDEEDAEEDSAEASDEPEDSPIPEHPNGMRGQGQSSASQQIANGRKKEPQNIAFDAELDPDLYGLRRSVSEFLPSSLP